MRFFAPDLRERDEHVLNGFLADVGVMYVKSCVLYERKAWAVSVLYKYPADPAPCSNPVSADLSAEQRERYEALCLWCNERAAALGRKPFVIASDRDLVNVAKNRVVAPNDLLEVRGFGPCRTERYGEEIVALLNSL